MILDRYSLIFGGMDGEKILAFYYPKPGELAETKLFKCIRPTISIMEAFAKAAKNRMWEAIVRRNSLLLSWETPNGNKFSLSLGALNPENIPQKLQKYIDNFTLEKYLSGMRCPKENWGNADQEEERQTILLELKRLCTDFISRRWWWYRDSSLMDDGSVAVKAIVHLSYSDDGYHLAISPVGKDGQPAEWVPLDIGQNSDVLDFMLSEARDWGHRDAVEKAYQILVNAKEDDYAAAIEEAVGFLGEALDTWNPF